MFLKSPPTLLFHLLALALLSSVSQAGVTFTSSTDPVEATASVSDDLLQTSLSSNGWQSNNNINNGTTGSSGENG